MNRICGHPPCKGGPYETKGAAIASVHRSRRGRRPLACSARQAIGAKVRIVRRPPERSRAGLGNRVRRMAGADSRPRPPRHGHVAAVDRIKATLGMAPIDAVRTVRADRQRFSGDAFATPLPAVRLRPASGFFGAYRCLRRMPSADPLVLPEPAPEGAGDAIGRSGCPITHSLLLACEEHVQIRSNRNTLRIPRFRALFTRNRRTLFPGRRFTPRDMGQNLA